jgi:hypothetical protein
METKDMGLAAAVEVGLGLFCSRPDAWPYRWLFPSLLSKSVGADGSLLVPAPPGVGVRPSPYNIFSYTVPRGFMFVLAAAMHDFQGTAVFHQGSGELLWSLVVNFAPSSLLAAPASSRDVYGSATRAVEGMQDMSFSHGSSREGPWPVPGHPRFEQGSVLSYQVTNAGLTLVAYDYVIASILGWLEPLASK